MFVVALIRYMLDWRFLVQLTVTLTVLLLLRIAALLVVRRRRYKLMREYYGYQGPELSIWTGNYVINGDPGARLEKLGVLARRYPKVWNQFYGDDPCLIFTDLDIIKKVFFDNQDSFQLRGVVYVDVPLAHGILFAGFNRWKWMRKVFSPSFSKFNMRNDRSANFIEESIKLMLKYIDNKLEPKLVNDGQTKAMSARLDIHSLLKSTALYLISTMAVRLPNVKVTENEPHVKGLDGYLHNSDKGAVVVAILLPFVRDICTYLANNFEYSKILSLITKGVNETIDKGLHKLKQIDQGLRQPDNEEDLQFVDTMVKLHHEGKLSRIELIGNVDAALYAGYDTTATTLAYCFWALATYPDIQTRLRDELKAHGTESQYLEQVLNETMRLYPVAPGFVCREATKTVKVDEFVIPEGTKVIYQQWVMHRDPKLWPEPLRFDPDRFAPGKVIHPCAWAPFGLAERKCLGYKLAYLEMKMIVCDILLRYKVNPVQPKVLMLEEYAFTLTKPMKKILVDLEKL